MNQPAATPMRVCVVGSGTRFLSGISVYTVRLANALGARASVSIITMRQLLPTQLYPGQARVGADLAAFEPDPGVQVYDGIDWFWLPSMIERDLALASLSGVVLAPPLGALVKWLPCPDWS